MELPDVFNIHFIPHSHVDPAWLLTPSETYSIYVSEMIASVVQELISKGNRTFVWEAIYFLKEFIRSEGIKTFCYNSSAILQNIEDTKNSRVCNNSKCCINYSDAITQLLERKQLEFVGGGWVAHDEALASTNAIHHSIGGGNKWIRETFGSQFLPKCSWQIDSFGHSSRSMRLFSRYRYKYQILNRVHYNVKQWSKRHGSPVVNYTFSRCHCQSQAYLQEIHGESLRVEDDCSSYLYDSCGKSLLTYILPEHYTSVINLERELNPSESALKLKHYIMRIVENRLKREKHLRSSTSKANKVECLSTPTFQTDVIILIGDDLQFSNAKAPFENLDLILLELNKNFHLDKSLRSELRYQRYNHF